MGIVRPLHERYKRPCRRQRRWCVLPGTGCQAPEPGQPVCSVMERYMLPGYRRVAVHRMSSSAELRRSKISLGSASVSLSTQ